MQHGRAKRVIVIGAGPIGLAAALGARDRGFDVTVLERDEVGASLRRWGPTRLFTPLRMNFPGLTGDDLLTGPEFADRVLVPAAAKLDVRTHTRVVSVSRRGLTRTDYAGHPLRAERAFRVLTDRDDVLEADVILDATGSTAAPLPYASRGESRVDAIRTLGEVHARREELRGKRVLLVGHGHSAANALAVLREAGAEVTWAVRTANCRPCEEIANDPLPERQRVVAAANALATDVRVERRAMVESVARNNGHIDVALTGNRRAEVDAVVALTGYRPASDYASELALEVSPVSEGGARLYRAISKITDCLCVPDVAKEDFATGEPGYYFVGARAYGRSRTFLLQTGLIQLEMILDSL
jgi:thioredoxin reductase